MKILVIGGGGREHTLIWKLAQSPKVTKLYCAPGNGGIAALAECVPIEAMDIPGVLDFLNRTPVDLTVVAPDDPLAMGMIDALTAAGHRAFGPDKKAARIEASKLFAKELMQKYTIPAAGYAAFDALEPALQYLITQACPIVVKADGLALGKGVIIAQTHEEAADAVRAMLVDKVFGPAGERVLIEEFLTGPEVSLLAFTDGKTIVPMVSSQDHKRVFDGDLGPNTGGMGTFSPAPQYTPKVAGYVEAHILKPTIEAMAGEGCPFRGVLYFGLMLTTDGPKVLEYNARFGDPETQVVLPRLNTDLVDILEAILDDRLSEVSIEWEDNAAVCVVLASGGYPGPYQKDFEIHGIPEAEADGLHVFHAGTSLEGKRMLTKGGRVLGVTAVADTLEQAIAKVYACIPQIKFEGMHYRRDIGRK